MSGAGLRERLRNETRGAHDALDETLDLLGAPLTLPQYRRLLGRFHGFHRALEPVLALRLDAALLRGRGKLPALEHDLEACGMGLREMAALPVAEFLPLADQAEAMGAFYVVEGGTLGGRLIGRHLRSNRSLPVEAQRYFNVYGEQTGQLWREACSTLDALTADEDRTVQAANAVFATLLGWLSPLSWKHGAERMVGATGIEPVTPTMSR